MEFSANGAGDVTFKDNIKTIEKVFNIIDKIVDKNCMSLEYKDNCNNGIAFWETDSHWHEEYLMEVLDAIKPYIKEGCLTYEGDDDCKWRYIFKDGEWEYQGGMVFYSMEDMVNYLQERGYEIEEPQFDEIE